MQEFVYIDGKFYPKEDARISVFDHGLLYGDGIFEGIRLYDGVIFKCKEHVKRLYDGAKAILLDIPVTPLEMVNIIKKTCRINELENGYIRLIVTRGFGDLGVNPQSCPEPSIICIAGTIRLYTEHAYKNGLNIITASRQRNCAATLDPQVKSLNYLNNVLAKTEASRQNAEEAILLNDRGVVCECTGDNIFIVKNGEIFTPPKSVGILNGITRLVVIELARKNNIKVSEEEFTLYNVYEADECFLTGTAAEIIAVKSVDKRLIGNGKEGEITNLLRSQFKEIRTIGEPLESN